MAVTSARGMTAPLESFTVPEILPPTPAQHQGENRAVNAEISSRTFVLRRSAWRSSAGTVRSRIVSSGVISHFMARLPLRVNLGFVSEFYGVNPAPAGNAL